jgi:uncharacterized membrane protein YcaP (DUF421 family)
MMVANWLALDADPKDFTFLQISLRGIIVFIVALAMIRISDKRFMAKISAVDAILGFILASMLARAVNGSAAFFPTLGGGFVLVLLHKFFTALAFRSDTFSNLVKGCAEPVIKDGTVQEKALRANHISKGDLIEELHQEANLESPEEVKSAYLERSGKISFVPYRKNDFRNG